MTPTNFNMDEVALCKNCNTMKHLNPEGLCGRCVKSGADGELRKSILQYITGLEDAEIVADDIMRVFNAQTQVAVGSAVVEAITLTMGSLKKHRRLASEYVPNALVLHETVLEDVVRALDNPKSKLMLELAALQQQQKDEA